MRRLKGWTSATAAVVAGLLTAVAVTPAVAADEPQSDQLWIDAPAEQSLPRGADGGEAQSRTLDIGLYHDNDTFTVTDGRVTVDIAGLAGVAEVTWPENCAPSGTTAVCDVPEVPVIGPDYGRQIPLTVRAAEGAETGARGRITYEATATGGPDGTLTAPSGSFDTTLTVSGGPDLALADAAPITHARPGSTRTVPFAVTNKGDATAHGFKVTMTASHGLAYLAKYTACTYTADPVDGGAENAPFSYATCEFDEELAPGDSFALPEPLTVSVTGHALKERLDIGVEPGGGATDINTGDNYTSLQIGADNTADFSVTGAAVTGAAGETVTASLTFRNNGPAWVAHLGSGDPVARVRLVVPRGTTVTDAPAECDPRTLSGGSYPNRTGAPRYDCELPYYVLEDAGKTYAFKVRIDSATPGTTGAVSVHPVSGQFAFDPDTSNNTAVLTVN
ncbi:hypothetical protein [Streptomyces neyagawaensis]|uniref:DUF11 domain-containing protein n=1 Tax=Streptomyces neyagawaensis TaxID=42238 RepID=A0ABV3AVU2_9ACTN